MAVAVVAAAVLAVLAVAVVRGIFISIGLSFIGGNNLVGMGGGVARLPGKV